MIGQVVINLMHWNFIKETAPEDNAATRGAHCTNPAMQGSISSMISNFSFEFIGTLILMAVVFTIFTLGKSDSLGINSTLFISLTILGIGAGLGSATGYAINPARDLGPRIIYQIMGKRMAPGLVSANWSYSWIPVVAPSLAGVVFGLVSLAY